MRAESSGVSSDAVVASAVDSAGRVQLSGLLRAVEDVCKHVDSDAFVQALTRTRRVFSPLLQKGSHADESMDVGGGDAAFGAVAAPSRVDVVDSPRASALPCSLYGKHYSLRQVPARSDLWTDVSRKYCGPSGSTRLGWTLNSVYEVRGCVLYFCA